MEKNEVVLIREDGCDRTPTSNVRSIKFLGEDGKERHYPLDQLRHQISVAEFWEGQPDKETRDQKIERAIRILNQNGIYRVEPVEMDKSVIAHRTIMLMQTPDGSPGIAVVGHDWPKTEYWTSEAPKLYQQAAKAAGQIANGDVPDDLKMVFNFPGMKPVEVEEGPLMEFVKGKLAQERKDRQSKIEQQGKAIDALKFTIEVMSKHIGKETKISEQKDKRLADREDAFKRLRAHVEQRKSCADRVGQHRDSFTLSGVLTAIDALMVSMPEGREEDQYSDAEAEISFDLKRPNGRAANDTTMMICNAYIAVKDETDVCKGCPEAIPHPQNTDCEKHGCIFDGRWAKCVPYPEVQRAAAEHVPVLSLKVTNPGEGDLAEASEAMKHWRPNFDIVKTNLRDCNKLSEPEISPKIQMCESCGKYEEQMELKSKTLPVSYHLCHNCLIELVDLRLPPVHFKNLIRNGHKAREFLLHGDFYDEEGNALQPRGG